MDNVKNNSKAGPSVNESEENDADILKKTMSPIAHTNNTTPNKWGLLYDSCILLIIILDLSLMFIDNILTSAALTNLGVWLSNYGFEILNILLNIYERSVHPPISMLLGFFTIFLISELFAKWVFAIINKTYYRWFFFPFVHWYEVVGCFPQFRIFRLLRAVVIGKRLYQMGHRFLPEKWLDTSKFYYSMILEELSDRVLLTTINNIRSQLSNSADSQAIVKRTIDNNRENIESMVLSMLQTELAPRLREELMPRGDSPISKHVSIAVGEAVAKTPELNFILRKIPIAGSMIEAQIVGISEKVGYNITDSISKRLLDNDILDELFMSISHGIASIDTSNPALEALVADIIKESLNAFENQVRNQQWQDHEEMEQIKQLNESL